MKKPDKFKPVPFDPKAYFAKRSAKDKAFKLAYDALEDEFAALAALLHARTEAGLTQADIAQRMGVTQPVVARIESQAKSTSAPAKD